MDVITYSYWDWSQSMLLAKGPQEYVYEYVIVAFTTTDCNKLHIIVSMIRLILIMI